MIITIHQPQYMPWAGYIGKAMLADIFVALDTVQFHKNEWQNRNKIRNNQSWQWLTVPVTYKFPEKIMEVKINNLVDWRNNHTKALFFGYKKAPYFQTYWDAIKVIFEKEWRSLADINIELIRILFKIVNVKAEIIRASELDIQTDDQTGRLVEICKRLEGDIYLSGMHGKEYIDRQQFAESGIGLQFHSFEHPIYPQIHGGFEPYMAVIDLLFNIGSSEGSKIISLGNKVESI